MIRRTGWLSAHEARVHAILLAAGIWAAAAWRWYTGPIVGAGDFAFFYTCGFLARTDAGRLYNAAAFHAAQASLVPASSNLWFPTVYPPQAALLMTPLSVLPYRVAMSFWVALSFVLVAAILRDAYRGIRGDLPDAPLVAAAALAFPPFAELIVTGQVSVIVLGACYAAWRALERGRPLLAGAAIGLLAVKPQFAIPFAVLVIATRDWRMLAGGLLSVGAQAIAVAATMGRTAFTGFAAMVPRMLNSVDVLEVSPYRSHSLRALTRLVPDWIGVPLWFIAVALVLAQMIRIWRSPAPLRVRFGMVLVAAVLCNPHLIVYDAVLLMLPLLWFAGWMESTGDASRFRIALYALFAAFAIPIVAAVRVQPTVPLLLWIGWLVSERCRRDEGSIALRSVAAAAP